MQKNKKPTTANNNANHANQSWAEKLTIKGVRLIKWLLKRSTFYCAIELLKKLAEASI